MAARPRRRVDTLLGSGPASSFERSHPPSGYPSPAAPVPGYAPPRLSQPETIDFSGSATLPEKKSGPPRWLVVTGLLAGLAGGSLLAHHVTRDQVASVVAESAEVNTPRPHRAAKTVPSGPSEAQPAPRAANPSPPEEAAPTALDSTDLPGVEPGEGAETSAEVRAGSRPKHRAAGARAHGSKRATAKRHPVGAHKKPARRH